MQLDEQSADSVATSALLIKAYDSESVTVGEQRLQSSFVLTGDALIHPWEPRSLKEIGPHHLAALVAVQPEVILIGSQQPTEPLAPETALQLKGLAVEAMRTDAACRTYNVLLLEGRAVAAIILL